MCCYRSQHRIFSFPIMFANNGFRQPVRVARHHRLPSCTAESSRCVPGKQPTPVQPLPWALPCALPCGLCHTLPPRLPLLLLLLLLRAQTPALPLPHHSSRTGETPGLYRAAYLSWGGSVPASRKLLHGASIESTVEGNAVWRQLFHSAHLQRS